jgi:peptidoglycan hydrolase-like protein with peptidoglycan-binding domain
LQALSNDIFEINRLMISMIQRAAVGLYLESSNDGQPYPWHRDLSVGSKSTQVADWQRNLVRIGHGPLDAWFGPAPRTATTAFQNSNGLEPDGIVGGLTRSRMEEALAASAATAGPDQTTGRPAHDPEV